MDSIVRSMKFSRYQFYQRSFSCSRFSHQDMKVSLGQSKIEMLKKFLSIFWISSSEIFDREESFFWWHTIYVGDKEFCYDRFIIARRARYCKKYWLTKRIEIDKIA